MNPTEFDRAMRAAQLDQQFGANPYLTGLNSQLASRTATQIAQQQMAQQMAQQITRAQARARALQAAYPGTIMKEEVKMTKEEIYQKELAELRWNTQRWVNIALACLSGAGVIAFAMFSIFGVKRSVIGVLSIVCGAGLYFGLHKAAFIYRKRKFDIDQATKAMLE
jgi:hypothetical protein